MRAKKLNRQTHRYRNIGVMCTNDIIQNVYIAVLSDHSRWINFDKNGYFVNTNDLKEIRDSIFISKYIVKEFDLQGNLVCRRKYSATTNNAKDRLICETVVKMLQDKENHHTITEISDKVGISRQQIYRIKKKTKLILFFYFGDFAC